MAQRTEPRNVAQASHPALLDHDREREAVDRVLAGVREGAGGPLVLRGAPGTGKTSLLEYAVERAADMRVARVAGVESEMALGFAALHQLLVPFLPRLDRLPGPQRTALRAAFGLDAAAPDRFLVGLAVLTLLADAAADQPLLVAVDDAQWLDQATTEVLAFVARRLRIHPIAFVVAVPDPVTGCQALQDLPDLYLDRPPERRARDLPARVLLLRAKPSLVLSRFGEAPSALLRAARDIQAAEPERARETLLDALYAGLMAGRLAPGGTLLEVVRAAQAWPTEPQSPPAAVDLLLDGFTARLTAGYPAAVPLLRDAVAAARAGLSGSSPPAGTR
jgi:AAA ATPase domain